MKLSEFKVGDRVRGASRGIESLDYLGEVMCIHEDRKELCVKRDDGIIGGGCHDYWSCFEIEGDVKSNGSGGDKLELISSNKSLTQKTMSMIDKLKELKISEPARTYKRAGLFDEQLMPTDEAVKLYLKDLMEEDKAFFEKVKAIEKDEKKKKKII